MSFFDSSGANSIWNPTDFITPQEKVISRARSYPIPQDPQHFIEERVYLQHAFYYSPSPDRGTPAPSDLPDCYLIGQDFVERVGNLITFVQRFANIPNPYRIPDTFSYEFPGFHGTFGTELDRDPRLETVNAEVEFRYYMIGLDGINTFDDVPLITALKYHRTADDTVIVRFLNDGETLFPATTPSRTDYKAMITAGDEIVAQDSTRAFYLDGPIIERQTVYIKAK